MQHNGKAIEFLSVYIGPRGMQGLLFILCTAATAAAGVLSRHEGDTKLLTHYIFYLL